MIDFCFMSSEFRCCATAPPRWRRARFRRTSWQETTRGSDSCRRWAGARARAWAPPPRALSIPSESKQLSLSDYLSLESLLPSNCETPQFRHIILDIWIPHAHQTLIICIPHPLNSYYLDPSCPSKSYYLYPASLMLFSVVTCSMSLGLVPGVTGLVWAPTLAKLTRMTMSSINTERGWCSPIDLDRTQWTILGGNIIECWVIQWFSWQWLNVPYFLVNFLSNCCACSCVLNQNVYRIF